MTKGSNERVHPSVSPVPSPHLHQQRRGVNLVALEALGQSVLVTEASVRHTVVPDHWVCQRDHLKRNKVIAGMSCQRDLNDNIAIISAII